MSVARLPQRVVDYFAVAKRDLKHDVFVAVRFPTVDHSDCEFPKDVSMFCFPDDAPGVEKEDGNSDSVADVVEFTFVLTEVDGKRVYVSALRDNSTGECFILTSHWAFFNQMAVFLRHAHYILTSRTSTPYPIESLLVNLIFEVPLPPRGRTEVVVPLIGTNRELVFRRPAPNGGPLDDFDVETLFHLLSVDAILSVFSATLSERRILFVSTKESSLTPVIESINNLLNPMFWRHIYIPLLPRILIEYVCTPMPFLMGVLRSYLPELALLGGICLVDLDQGTVVYVDDAGKGLLTTSPVPLLPDRPSRALSKRLRQATTDGKIDRVAIADAFQRFFAVVLGHYRKYVDFENADDAFDKRQFLEASPDGCESLSSLIDTQMFASFIDDRVRFSDDIDTLLFDDYILREQGRPAAFLSDTSQAHKTRHVCMAPVTVPGVSGPFTYWNGLQQVEPERIPSARAVDVLVDSTTESQTLASGMSHASLKFFMDQKVYSRQFHSMKIASTRHDIAFNSVIQTTIAWTGAERYALQVLSRLQWPTLAACSITALFEALHSYANLTLTARSVALTDMETNLERDLSSKLAFIDRDLKILFDEARQLDADATANKAQLESCKSALAAARKRLKSIETASPPSTARWSSTREMGKLVAARSEVQALEIERAEAEATFRTLLDLYNKRIPEIISELQRLNDERVGTFRSAISSHANSRRQQLKAEEAALADLESITKASPPPVQRVNSLVAKFIPLLDNFSEAQIASAPLSSESPTGPRSRSDAECTQDPPVPDSTQPFRYSMLMWGQFDLLFDHAVKAKAIVKQVEAALASASALFDSLPTATNRGGGLLSSLSLSPHKPLSTATSSLAGTKAEAALLDALEHQLSQLDRAAQKTMKRIKKTAVDARVLKRECKGSFAMIEKRRQKLELDVSSAQDAYSRSLSAPSVSDLNRLKPQPSNVTPKSQREIDMMSRQWQTSQVQHHCGIAYLLDQFQKVEHNRILTLRSALLDFHGALYDYYAKYRAGMDEMVPIIDAVSKGSVIYELVHRLHGHISSPVERKQPDLISSCNADQFPEVCQQISSGLDLVATIAGQLEQVIGLDDALVSRIRKQSWSLNLQDGLETVNAALKAFHQFVAEDWVNILETSAAERRKQLADLRRMRETLQSRLAMAITKEHNGRKLKTDCAAQFQRSSEEVTRIEAALKSAREKLARAEAEDSSPTTSSSIMSFMKKPVAKHRQRVAELEADLKKLQSATEQLSVEKCSSEVAYQDTLGSLYNFIQEIEMNRVEAVACCARRMNELGQELVLRAWETLHVLETSARKVDARLDMTLWVAAARKKAAYPCPDAVLRNLERSALDDDNNEKGDGVDPTDRNRALGIDSDSSSKEHRLHVTTSADPSEASDDDATPVPSRLLATPRITISSDSPGPLEPKRSLTFEEQVVTQAPLSSDEDPANVQQCLKDLCEQVAQLMTNESRTVIR